MAERRMFSKKIVQSGKFLKMPVSARELYFQMGMSADDDGVVEAWNLMNLTNAREDDLRILLLKGYIQILDNEDMVVYLTDWETNNQIRKDRYHAGIYRDLKLKILDALANGNQMTTIGQPNDNQMATEVSLGKDSLVKYNNPPYIPPLGEEKEPEKPKKPKPAFVPPTIDEVKAYCIERNNNVDPQAFYDYYATANWHDAKGSPVKNWKQRMVTWEGRNYGNNNNTTNNNDNQKPLIEYRLSDV